MTSPRKLTAGAPEKGVFSRRWTELGVSIIFRFHVKLGEGMSSPYSWVESHPLTYWQWWISKQTRSLFARESHLWFSVDMGRMGPGVCWRFFCSLLRHCLVIFSRNLLGQCWNFCCFSLKTTRECWFPNFLRTECQGCYFSNLARKCNNQPEKFPSSLVRCTVCFPWNVLDFQQMTQSLPQPIVWSYMPAVILDTWNLLRKPLFWLEFGPSLVGWSSTKTGTNRLQVPTPLS